MVTTTLPDILLQAAADAGCRDTSRLRHTLEDACDKR